MRLPKPIRMSSPPCVDAPRRPGDRSVLATSSEKSGVTWDGCHSLLESPAKQHRGPYIFFLPAVEIAVAVTSRAGQILRDLGVATPCASLPQTLSQLTKRGFPPTALSLTGRGEAVEVQQPYAVYNGGADPHQPPQSTLVD